MASWIEIVNWKAYMAVLWYTASWNPVEQWDLSRIKEQSDYNAAFTYYDEWQPTERVHTIVHSSATLWISATETFQYDQDPVTFVYTLKNITTS